MLLTITLLILGFILLIGGAEFLVRGSASLAKNLGISPLVIGLTIVAFGTSAPELVVNLLAVTSGADNIGIGNIIGSNITNILLILGVAAAITPLKVKNNTVWKEIPFAILAVFLMYILANDRMIDGMLIDQISHIDGLVLISIFIIFMYYVFGTARTQNPSSTDVKTYKTPVSMTITIAGLIGLVSGGQILVDSAVNLAQMFHVSEALIGLTIVAIGTSLPELATIIVASTKKQTDIVIGSVIGSNIFNVFWVVGSVAIIQPIKISRAIQPDLIIAIAVSLLLFIMIFLGHKKKAYDRFEGYIFITLYIIYIIYTIVRG